MNTIARVADGFVYCVARKGVTGDQTDFSRQIGDYLDRCRAATRCPWHWGLGSKTRRTLIF
jgi:tryptophan synthase alpha chain